MMPSVAMNQLEKKSQLDLSSASIHCHFNVRNVPVLFVRIAAGRQLPDVRQMLSAHSRTICAHACANIYGHILLLFRRMGCQVRFGMDLSIRRGFAQTPYSADDFVYRTDLCFCGGVDGVPLSHLPPCTLLSDH